MRRAILLCVAVVLALVLVSPAATAIPKQPKGCPAEPSIWTLVSFGAEPYTANSLYKFYFVDNRTAAEAFAEVEGFELPRDEAEAYDLVEEEVAGVDRNGDHNLCMFWLGGNLGMEDYWVSVVDNNSNASH